MKQETPITLHVKSVIEDDGNDEVIEFRTTGFYYVKQQKVYLSYYEEHDLGKVKTIVKVSEGEVLIMRSGAVKMNQRFITGLPQLRNIKCHLVSLSWKQAQNRFNLISVKKKAESASHMTCMSETGSSIYII